VGCNGASEELFQASLDATSPATDDDQLDIADVGQSGECVRDVARQLPEGHVNGVVCHSGAHLCHESLVEVGVFQFG